MEVGIRHHDGALVRKRGAPQHRHPTSGRCARHSEAQPRVDAETSQSCVWSRERSDEMEGPFDAITSEHGFTSCALDPCACVLIRQNKVREVWPEFMWTTCWEEVMKRLAEPFWEVQREFDSGAWDVGAMGFKERQLTHMANNDIGMEHYKHELHQIEVAKSDKLKPERLLSTKKKCHVIVVVLEAFDGWLIIAVHTCPSTSQRGAVHRTMQPFRTCSKLNKR